MYVRTYLEICFVDTYHIGDLLQSFLLVYDCNLFEAVPRAILLCHVHAHTENGRHLDPPVGASLAWDIVCSG